MRTHNKTRNKHRGSSFDDFLKEEGIYEEVCAAAAKRILADTLSQVIEKKEVSVTTLAKRMKISRATVYRILDIKRGKPEITLQTMERAARAVGKRWELRLVEA